MTRLDQTFRTLAAESRAALIPFVTANDPYLCDTVQVMHALVAAGANVLELGVPFSDPMADGPVIQRSSERALNQGTTPADVFSCVRKFREVDTTTPVVLMGYLNPIESLGYEFFAEQACAAGVDGAIVVDLPPEEALELSTIFEDAGISTVFLLSPTTTSDRVSMVAQRGRGFVYYVAVTGVTGSKAIESSVVETAVTKARDSVSLPICVGFGIRSAQAAADVARYADGAVVGSALISAIETLAEQNRCELDTVVQTASDLIKEFRSAMDAAR